MVRTANECHDTYTGFRAIQRCLAVRTEALLREKQTIYLSWSFSTSRNVEASVYRVLETSASNQGLISFANLSIAHNHKDTYSALGCFQEKAGMKVQCLVRFSDAIGDGAF